MTQKPTPGDLPALPEGRIQGRHDFADLVRLALQTAAREGWPHIVLSDPDFGDWPLGERVVIDALNAWAARGRKLQFLAMDFDRLREQHPRLVQWRTTWAHIVEAHACRSVSDGELPSAIWSGGWTMERLDIGHCLIVASRRPERRTQLQERLRACWQQGSPAFPATVLGL